MSRQTIFVEGSGEWADDRDEDGKLIKVYRGQKGILGLPLVEVCCDALKNKDGLVLSVQEGVRTTYDFVFKTKKYDRTPALGRCVKPHVYKDALKPDGTPNPKPVIVQTPGEWETITYATMKKQARAFGMCLRKKYEIGVRDKVAIWSGNSVEWLIADLACAAYNFTSVSVYDTLGPNAASYIVADSGAKVLVCEPKTFKLVPKLLQDEIYVTNPARDLKLVVVLGRGDKETQDQLEKAGIKVCSMDAAIEEFEHAVDDDGRTDTPPTERNIVTIMYTSGTTGMPKGVILTHQNIVATISMMLLTPSININCLDVHLSYLPLAHIFERQNCMAFLTQGACIYFASAGAKSLLGDLSVIRPTIFAGVPKVYENVRDAVLRKLTGKKKQLFEMALAAKKEDLHTGCGYCALWDVLFKVTKKALGGRVRFCVTGGAPISKDTLEFVLCAFAPVVQGYGATETSAASTLTMSFDLNLGHVGAPLGTCAIRLVDVPEMNYYNATEGEYQAKKVKEAFQSGKRKVGGEVWIGGTGTSPGYYDPAIHALKEGIPSNGMAKKSKEDFFEENGISWFRTGDIGVWTEENCLRIIDRRKNMFKTSIGEYIPVEEVEKVYQDGCPFADFVFLPKETKVAYVGLCMVVSESAGAMMKWASDNNVVGDEKAVASSKEFQKHIMELLNGSAKEKKLQRFMWIVKPENLHIEYQPIGYQEQWVGGIECPNGHTEQLLTATFKARRAQLNQFFAPHFAKMYPDRPADHILP
eukprot:TRINITY_DN8069_c2_g1_i1.p1 TRINITY_DN8069_c2_g1~~TRINITY_DN8069_c2_g1_i1.p1  ORF type:complete len:798 (+),score=175.38 TRINITY_DN8069_c2_g1_i1:130-2394(+)